MKPIRNKNLELESQLELETGRPSLRYTLEELNNAPATIRSMLPEGLKPEDYSCVPVTS